MGPKYTVNLPAVAETLLIPLLARAHDATSPDPILGDETAAETVAKLDYDFDKLEMPVHMSMSIAIRTKVFDNWTSSFIAAHLKAVVVHIGCGLDDRARRLSPGRDIMWIDVDLPEVVNLRSQVMPIATVNFQYRLLGADITSTDWLDSIQRDRPTLVLMEGVTSYLLKADVGNLLHRLTEWFAKGEILLDCINSTILDNETLHPRDTRRMGAKLRSAVDDLAHLEAVAPGLKVVEALRFFDAPGVERLPWSIRLRMYLASWIPSVAVAARLVRLRFDRPSP
jgi:methyltransferase (TIGR00027 family)